MQRRHQATIASLVFAAFWAALSWPWLPTAEHPAKNLPAPWLLCAFFLVVAGGLAANRRWARWLGLVAAVALVALLALVFIGAYFISLFGDQAFGAGLVSWFLTGIALSVTLVVLLAKPLDAAPSMKEAKSPEPTHPVWIPIGFSLAYLAGSCLVGIYGGSGTWEGMSRDIGVYAALFAIALPSTLLIWLAWAWWSRRRAPRSRTALMMAGVTIPFVVAAVAYEIVTVSADIEERRTERQLANAHLSEVTDELLLSPRGNPVGIRLRYAVRFDEGLDDVRYRPIVSLGFETPFVPMTLVRAKTAPVVKGSFVKGEYRFTEDFIPSYSPGFMQFPDAPQRADDRCFYWGYPRAREIATDMESLHATINVSFPRSLDDHQGRRSSSTLAYTQHAFYAGALAEGARDCP